MTLVRLGGLSTSTPVLVTGSASEELHAAVLRAWSRCPAPAHGARDSEHVSVALDVPGVASTDADVTGTDLARVLQSLTQQVTYAKIAAQRGRLFMMHAGAVANAEGDTVAFVAPGGTGKTTLIRTMGERFGYLTDETVGVDADASVHPYPKPLSVRGAPGRPKAETSPDDLGLVRPPAACTLRRIVLLARNEAHRGDPRVEELGRYAAIAALAPETSALSDLPRPLHWLDGLLAGLQPVVRLHYREVETVRSLVAGWLEAS
ncbi:MAG TPA: hypothetical protein DEH05_05770 [Propionibacteriaceae bacterium]|nr:hypothetical protein [Propionibacteriaceae bacterium]